MCVSIFTRQESAGSSCSEVSGYSGKDLGWLTDTTLNSFTGHGRAFVSYLHHFPLWTFRKDQDLVVKRVQRLPDGLGLLLGHADPVFQEVNFDVGR